VLLEIGADLIERRCNARELWMPRAMRLLQLREIAGDSGTGGPDVGVVHRHDVVDEPIDGPPHHVIVVDEVRRQGGQGADHVRGIRRRRLACISERTTAAAAEVDAELFENAGRPVIGRHDIPDGSLEWLTHVPRILSSPSIAIGRRRPV
jgi:hypothetical protein